MLFSLIEQELKRTIFVGALPPPRRDEAGHAIGFGLNNVRGEQRRVLGIVSAARRIVAAFGNVMRGVVITTPVNPFALVIGRAIPGVIKCQHFARNVCALAVVLRRNKIEQARRGGRFGGLSGCRVPAKHQQQKNPGFHVLKNLPPQNFSA